jgi:hypothetical protein
MVAAFALWRVADREPEIEAGGGGGEWSPSNRTASYLTSASQTYILGR